MAAPVITPNLSALPEKRERWWTVQELSVRWFMSDDYVRRLIRSEPGILAFNVRKPGKRTFNTYRVPDSVRARIERRFTVS